MTITDGFDEADRFNEKEIALAMFDCITNEHQKNLVVCDSAESYAGRFQELMKAHHEAPISGVRVMGFSEGLITFDNDSELWFTIRSADDTKTDNEEDSDPMSEDPPEKLNEFLNGFKVS